MSAGVPTLSLADFTDGEADARSRFCARLFDGFQRYGFIILTDHPVATDLLDRAYALSEAFFDQSDEAKNRYVGGQRGYTPFGVEHAKDNPSPDLKEFWQIGPERMQRAGDEEIAPDNIWPSEPEGFQETFSALFNALQSTGEHILEALTPGLKVTSDFFTPRVADGNSVLRLLHYPPIASGTDPNCVRAAAHEDINLITILVAASQSGLELLDRDGQWLPVETERNNLIVDAGDMLARITNDVVPATTHRVMNPTGPNVSRYSMPFFMHPNSDVVLSCLPSCIGDGAKHPDITAGAFLAERLREIGLTA